MERNMRNINKLIYLYFLDLKRLISRIYAISGGAKLNHIKTNLVVIISQCAK
jgi:hypothetical protein